MGLIQSTVGWRQLTTLVNISFILAVQIITFAVILLLVLLVARARSNFAKWILVLCFALGVPLLWHTLKSGHLSGMLVLTVVQTVVQVVAMLLLFMPDANEWMHNRTRA